MPTVRKRRGGLIVDAALCMPIFVIAFALLLLLLMQAGTEETLVYTMTQAADTCIRSEAAGQAAELQDASAAVQLVSYAAALKGGLAKEWDEGPAVHVVTFLTDQDARLSGNLCIDHLTWTHVSCKRNALFSLGKTDGIFSIRAFVFRPWRGESKQPVAPDEERVYVFPKYGEKYHNSGCRILQEGSVEQILTEKLKRQYFACKTCKPSSLAYGCIVFMFSDGSRMYHRKECSCITKYYVSMPKSEAEAEGYTPCFYCRGGL